MSAAEWKAIGLYAALVLAASLYNPTIAYALVSVFVAAALIRNSGQIADWLKVPRERGSIPSVR